jgi:hypothetical protein
MTNCSEKPDYVSYVSYVVGLIRFDGRFSYAA